MSSNVFLFNASIRHQIFLQRFAGGEFKKLEAAVRQVERESKKLLRKDNLSNLSKKRLKEKLAALRQISKGIYTKANTKILASMKQFADYEAGFTLRMLDSAVETDIQAASKLLLETEVFTKRIAFGLRGELTIAQALTQFSIKKSREIVQVVKDGIVQGLTNSQIQKNIGLATTRVQAVQAKTLVRTITNHVSSAARTAVFTANKDVIRAVRYTAVLDGRTTAICGSLDGKVFPIGHGPRPPMHWNCRSITTPIIKKEFDAVPDVKTTRFARNEKGKTNVGGKTTYNSWLKGQSKGFQEEVLGKDKAKLFRDGGLKMDKFVDKNFKPLTLDQLKRREPLAFDKAGL